MHQRLPSGPSTATPSWSLWSEIGSCGTTLLFAGQHSTLCSVQSVAELGAKVHHAHRAKECVWTGTCFTLRSRVGHVFLDRCNMTWRVAGRRCPSLTQGFEFYWSFVFTLCYPVGLPCGVLIALIWFRVPQMAHAKYEVSILWASSRLPHVRCTLHAPCDWSSLACFGRLALETVVCFRASAGPPRR